MHSDCNLNNHYVSDGMNYVMVALVTNVRRSCVLCKVHTEAEGRLINETVLPGRYGLR